MDDVRLQSATALARRIRERTLSSRNLVETHIAHVERVNPSIRALVADRFGEARREADLADRKVREGGDLGPLHGVPCTIKENFALTGMPNSSGLVSRKHLRSTSDAPVVARLRAAGAIPLGVTNTSELCMWIESDNRVYGRSNNPYDTSRIVGGSSGGEGAIVGSGASPFGLGSDIGGSIRGPAFFNGVFGHKATGGLVPGTGQFPTPGKRAFRYLTTGPLARRAEDLLPLLRVLAGPDGEDPGCFSMPLGDPADVSFDGLVVVDIADNGVLPASDEIRDAQSRAAGALAARGAKIRHAKPLGLKRQFDIWSAMLGVAQDQHFGEMLGGGTSIRPLVEIARCAARRSDHMFIASLLALVDPLPNLMPRIRDRAIEVGHALKRELLELMGDRGVLLYPVYPTTAPRHGEPVLETLRLRFPYAYTGIFNVLEMPATSVPMGLSAEGLPLGFQVVSAPGNDHVCIAEAMELERTFGGWVPPPLAGMS